MKVLLGKMQWKIHTAVIVHGKERNVTALILVPRGIAAVLTFAHVNVSTITQKIMYQIYDKVREMSLYFRYFLTWEVLQRQVSVIYYEFFGLFF